MIQFFIGAFIGAAVSFAVIAFVIAAEDDKHDRRG